MLVTVKYECLGRMSLKGTVLLFCLGSILILCRLYRESFIISLDSQR
jgi:hypothetical protein